MYPLLRQSGEHRLTLRPESSLRLSDFQDDPEGVLVCLQCFNGGCFGEGRRHAYLHYEKTKHGLGVVVKRTRKEQKKRVSNLTLPATLLVSLALDMS